MSFYAKSADTKYGMENMRIGYSTTGKDINDFVWITGVVDIPPVWAKFRYVIPADAE